MEHKKKYYGGIKVLLLPLFIILLGIYSTCYANVSEEYVDNMFNTFGNTMVVSSFQSYKRSIFLNHTQENVETLTNIINTYLVTNNLENATDRNIVFGIKSDSQSSMVLYVFVANNGAPGSIDNLDFIVSDLNYYFTKYNNNRTDFIYRLTINFTVNISSETITSISKGSEFVLDNYSQYQLSFTQDGFGYCTYNNENITVYSPNVYCAGLPNIYVKQNGVTSPGFLSNINGNYIIPTPTPTPTPEITPTPSTSTTGTITNNSGDTTGKIDLNGIEQGIGNIQNQISGDTQKVIENQNQNTQAIVNTISGEVGKINNTLTSQPNLNDTSISSGDIESSLGFDFMADPYANFWFELTNGLNVSLTGSVRQLPIELFGYQGVFDLDKLGFNYPPSIRLILTSVSTVSMVWILVKWWKIIVDKLTSGDMDEVLALNEEERYY